MDTDVRLRDRQSRFGSRWLATGTDVARLVDRLVAAAGPQLDEEQKGALETAVTRLTDRGLYVVVLGEFKRGKSSLLNALLGRRDVFPVDEDIATSIVTAVSYGEEECAQVFVDGEEGPRSVPLAEIREFVTESCNPRNAQRVRFVVVRGPFPALSRGLTLLDTPGEGCLNVEHTAATLAMVPEADAVIVVVDAVEPVTTQELEFVDTVRASTTNMLFAVTKCDLAAEPQVMIENLRAKLAGRYGADGATVPIVGVSSTRMLDGLDEGDVELVQESGIEDLDEVLWSGLLRRAEVAAATRATAEIRRVVENVVVPMRAELIALADEPSRQEALRRRLLEAKDRLDASARPDAQWRQELDQLLFGLGADVEADFAAEIDALRRELDDVWLRNDELLASPEQAERSLVSSLVLRLNTVSDRLREGLRLADVRVEQDIQLDLQRTTLQSVSFDPCLLDAPVLAEAPKGLWQRTSAVVREHWDSGGIKAILRGLAGVAATTLTVLAPGPGGRTAARALRSWDTLNALSRCSGDLVSAAGDIGVGIRGVQNAERTTKYDRIRDVLHAYLEVNGRRAGDALHDVVAALPYSLRAEVEERIGQERAMVADALSRMESGGSDSDPAHASALERQVTELNEIHAELDSLDEDVMAGARTQEPPTDDRASSGA